MLPNIRTWCIISHQDVSLDFSLFTTYFGSVDANLNFIHRDISWICTIQHGTKEGTPGIFMKRWLNPNLYFLYFYYIKLKWSFVLNLPKSCILGFQILSHPFPKEPTRWFKIAFQRQNTSICNNKQLLNIYYISSTVLDD